MKKIILIFLLIFVNSAFAEEVDIVILTHEFSNQTVALNENKITGIAGDILTNALSQSNISYKIIYLPWKRAQLDTLLNSNKKTFILPLTRNEERENNYIWVSKLYELESIFLTLKSEKNIDNFNDAKNKIIGVLFGSSMEQTLKDTKNGLYLENIETSFNQTAILKKLLDKRIDTWYDVKIDIVAELKNQNQDISSFNFGKKIDIEENFLATSKNVPKELIQKIENSFEKFKKTPEYIKILKNYLGKI
ncbi:ABC transporter substrate-binding protein [Pigmentibacter sp. JX0631]|uniref:substrate-binding periplasmic protein n=1 Tax=Pigmentibacter sp. JX0631 TaxID=2976982 RepID=UPI002469BB8B|nr:ABC transporter substrate-binding protein [Pigmentibacter sp. JX0631]WGL59515.1 ABC transporter substrate-binding protein [Pigmentibacter sp. JX0631]